MEGVTGRDSYIVAKALAYAIEAIEALPPEWQEGGDQGDIKKLLDRMVSEDADLAEVQRSARNHLTRGGAPLR